MNFGGPSRPISKGKKKLSIFLVGPYSDLGHDFECHSPPVEEIIKLPLAPSPPLKYVDAEGTNGWLEHWARDSSMLRLVISFPRWSYGIFHF